MNTLHFTISYAYESWLDFWNINNVPNIIADITIGKPNL